MNDLKFEANNLQALSLSAYVTFGSGTPRRVKLSCKLSVTVMLVQNVMSMAAC